jgi:hemerythrin-like domain-containing protein
MTAKQEEKMEIYRVLQQEHRALLSALDEIIAGNKKDTDTFGRAKDLFMRHKEAEEETFYARLEEDPQLRPMIQQARMEHHAANVLFKETDWMTFNEEKWMAKVKVLREMIGHHIEKEEGEMFDSARRVLDADDADMIGESFEQEKAA